MGTKRVIKHILGSYNKQEQTQSCIICNQVIHNYKGGMYAPDENGNIPENNGWQEGEHYIAGTNPQYFSSTPPHEDKYFVVPCNLTIHTN